MKMQIETIEIKNYRLFRDTAFENLPSVVVVVGANGSGKSTLFDIFSFLEESLTENVAAAVARRGGFRELVSRGQNGPITIIVKFRESSGRVATYHLEIATENGHPVVHRESLDGGIDASELRTLLSSRRFLEPLPPSPAGAPPQQFTRLFEALRTSLDDACPLVVLETPETGLHPSRLADLGRAFRDYARAGGQLFVSTCSPDLLDAFELDEILWLERRDGFTSLTRPSDSELLRRLGAEGDRPGALWRQGMFEATATGGGER